MSKISQQKARAASRFRNDGIEAFWRAEMGQVMSLDADLDHSKNETCTGLVSVSLVAGST